MDAFARHDPQPVAGLELLVFEKTGPPSRARIGDKRRAGKVMAVEHVEELDRTWANWAGSDNGEALVDALRDCLQGISQRARLALELRFREDSSREAIAAALKITEHGAKNLMQRAKQHLRA